jgi:predicted anti-sigma-YlaC factor YlaD
MDCRTFESLVADFQQGNLAPDICSDVERHLDNCKPCRLLADIASGKLDLLPPSSQQALTLSILTKTSGPACGQAQELLCGFVDGALPKPDAALVSQHLEYCAECHGLAANLIELQQLLPSLAGIQPDPVFAEEVARATDGTYRLQPGLRTRLLEWWIRLVQRPRFSFEAAYLGTLVLVLLVGNPFPTMKALSVHAVEAVSRVAPASVRNDEAGLLHSAKGFAVELSDREQRFRQDLEQVRVKGEDLVSGSVRYQATALESGFVKAVGSIRGFWRRLWSGEWRRPEPVKRG